MSHTSKIFDEVPVKVQNKNGFDLSHLNCGTSKCGQLVPVMCKLLPPNSDFTLGINMNVELPPLATSFMGRIDAIVEGFVVPCSMLYGGWKQFISNQQSTMFPVSQSGAESSGGFALPYFHLETVRGNGTAQFPEIASFTTLLNANNNIVEYLGFRPHSVAGGTGGGPKINLLPLLAYHLIWDVYYRNKQITKTIFAVNPNTSVANGFNAQNVSLIWHSFYLVVANEANANHADFSASGRTGSTPDSRLTFPDGVSVFSTRQRNYSRDYFTAGTPDPQQGNASKLVFDTSGANGEFTINALRAANSLQKFLETNNLSGDYADMMRNRWGTHPIDADFDEPYYLGRVVLPVYQKSVYQNQNADSGAASEPSPNPFVRSGALGGRGAHGGFSGEGSICDKFHNSTWSYVMCLFSLVPHAMYAYGLNRELTMLQIGHFPAPELQSIGNEEIFKNEVYYDPANPLDAVFSYIPRYSRFKYMDDEIHGELRPGRTLDSFVLQRVFPAQQYTPSLTTNFLEISQDALDDVFAVSTSTMNLSCWYEIFFEFKVSMPLADFCIPTLGDIQDTHTIKSKQGGSRL